MIPHLRVVKRPESRWPATTASSSSEVSLTNNILQIAHMLFHKKGNLDIISDVFTE